MLMKSTHFKNRIFHLLLLFFHFPSLILFFNTELGASEGGKIKIIRRRKKKVFSLENVLGGFCVSFHVLNMWDDFEFNYIQLQLHFEAVYNLFFIYKFFGVATVAIGYSFMI